MATKGRRAKGCWGWGAYGIRGRWEKKEEESKGMAPPKSTWYVRQTYAKGKGKAEESEDITREKVYRDLWRVSISLEYRKIVRWLSRRYGDHDKYLLKELTEWSSNTLYRPARFCCLRIINGFLRNFVRWIRIWQKLLITLGFWDKSGKIIQKWRFWLYS